MYFSQAGFGSFGFGMQSNVVQVFRFSSLMTCEPRFDTRFVVLGAIFLRTFGCSCIMSAWWDCGSRGLCSSLGPDFLWNGGGSHLDSCNLQTAVGCCR